MKNKSQPTARPVRKDTIPTLKTRLEQESERERELKQTVVNLSEELKRLRSKLVTANSTKPKETAASKLALKLGEMEAEVAEENAEARNTIPHMQKLVKPNDISRKQNAIESKAIRRAHKKLPLIGLDDNTKPELHSGITVSNRMPDLEEGRLIQQKNSSIFDDGFNMIQGIGDSSPDLQHLFSVCGFLTI